MNESFSVLVITAASLGFLHTVLGVDHYVPFIALSKSLGWSKLKSVYVTTLCGIGHVLSTVVIGIIGIAMGFSLTKFEAIENIRGEIAGWLLILFGTIYTIYGIVKSKKVHSHFHVHTDKNIVHAHTHNHLSVEHKHFHGDQKSISAWTLFIIFVFGPCEALIPILMIPAINHSFGALLFVVLIFGIVTIATMLIIVLLGLHGIELLPQKKLEKHIHTFAGLTILICGIGVQFFGL